MHRTAPVLLSLVLGLPVALCAATPRSAAAGDIEGVPIGGPCGICGRWIPAGGSCSCWTRRREPPPPPPEPLPPQPPPPDPAELARQRERAEALAFNETGVGHFNARRWQQAIDAFQTALAKWPDNQVIRTNLANARNELAGEQLRRSSDRAATEIRRVLAEGQLGDLEALDRQVRELERERAEGWAREFAERERGRAEFREAKASALARMGAAPDPGAARPLPWEAGIANPQIAKIMRELRAIEVPPPVPARAVAMSWKALATERGPGVLEKGSEFGFLAWDLLAKPGGGTPLHCKVLVMAGKTLIAGEDGAMVHLVKEDRVYEEALAYLKDPATNRKFAELVRDLREPGRAPESADPAMLRAARAIIDPKLGSSGTKLAWDAMLSPEARAAMVRRACLEAGGELLGMGTEGLVGGLTRQQRVFDAARLERRRAQALLRRATDAAEREQLGKAVAHADYVLAYTYRFEKAGATLGAYGAGKIAGQAAEESGGPRAIPAPGGAER